MKYHIVKDVNGKYRVHWKGIAVEGATERRALLMMADALEKYALAFREWARQAND